MSLSPQKKFIDHVNKNPVPNDCAWNDCKKLLIACGFEIKKANHGYTCKHPALKDEPWTRDSFIMISTHSGGVQGKIGSKSICDLRRAIELTETYKSYLEGNEK